MASHKCPKCERSFSMAAHLVRHMNATHGTRSAAGRKSGKSAGRAAGRKGRRPGRPKGSKNKMSPGSNIISRGGGGAEGPSRILREMSTYRDELVAQRSAIEAQIAGLEGAIGMVGGNLAVPTGAIGSARGRRGRRRGGRARGMGMKKSGGSEGGRAGSLKEMIVRVLGSSGRALTPSEIAQNVVKVGYKTTASNLTKAVSNALPLINQVKKAGRGLYQA